MSNRKWFPELIGMHLYCIHDIIYFYAWDYKHARKKFPEGELCIMTDFGTKLRCND